MADKYDHDCPFEAFITNLGKYNEGELVGEWVKFPTTPEQLQEVFQRIGIGQKDDFGQPYEEWFITDYDCYVDGLYNKLGEYANLDELNYLAAKIEDMDRWDFERFQAAMEVGDHSGSIQEIINLTENLDCYDVYPDIHDHDDLGQYYINELDAMQVPEHLIDYIDYEAYGRDVAINEGGEFTSFGYLRDTGDRFVEFYDGDRENIPEEYRVTSVPEDAELTEIEQVEWAMDLAFDLDEFFRQHDPHYAAQRPEPHEQKEVIADLLLEGKTAVLRQQLEEMAQTENDVLPGRIAEYER
jgi:antirestriction protein